MNLGNKRKSVFNDNILPVPRGGTGDQTITQNALVVGNGILPLSTTSSSDTTIGALTITNNTNATATGGVGALVLSAGGASINNDVWVGGKLMIGEITARSGQNLTIDPNGSCTINALGSGGVNLIALNSSGITFSGGTASTKIAFNFQKFSGSTNFTIGIAQTGGDYITGTLSGDTALQSNVNTQSIWIGGGVTPYASFNSSVVKIPNGTGSTTTTSGALVVTGGIGCSQNIWCNKLFPVVGTVTQTTSVTTAVTLNAQFGAITMFAAAPNGAVTSFTLSNSFIPTGANVFVWCSNTVSSTSGLPLYITATAISAGACTINVANPDGVHTSTTAPIIYFICF